MSVRSVGGIGGRQIGVAFGRCTGSKSSIVFIINADTDDDFRGAVGGGGGDGGLGIVGRMVHDRRSSGSVSNRVE